MKTHRPLTVMSIFGTRPEAIKMAPLVRMMQHTPEIHSLVCVSAQHRAMLDSVMQQFDLKADYDLNLMKAGQTLTSITTGVLEGMDRIFNETRPDIVLVHGDTTTSSAAALAAFYHKIPVGHVEAGLRSYDRYSPWPEEMNRQLTARLATLHFAPTERARKNLQKEGITNGVHVVGNTVIDALHMMVRDDYLFLSEEVRALPLDQGRWILLTAHRRENISDGMETTFRAIRRIVDEEQDLRIVYPIHPNPEVRTIAHRVFDGQDRIFMIEPLEVSDMHNLMRRCYFVMTDSGGLQEEAPALGKPVIVLRKETERPEVVEAGKAILAGVSTEDVYAAAHKLLHDPEMYRSMATAINPYGDGHTSERIIAILKEYAENL